MHVYIESISHDDCMPRRRVLTTAAVMILLATSSVILGWFLGSQDLNGAAAWSNILALPVGIIGLGVGVIGLRQQRQDSAPTAHVPPIDPFSGSGAIVQQGHAGRDQFNVAGSTINITNHDR
jgi:hypothetical protein